MLHDIRIPRDHLLDLSAGEFRANAAKPRLVRPGTGVHPAATALGPFRHIAVSLDASGTQTPLMLLAACAALSAGRDFFQTHLLTSHLSYLIPKTIAIKIPTRRKSGKEGFILHFTPKNAETASTPKLAVSFIAVIK